MPRVFIPPLLQDLTQGVDEVEVQGSSVGGILVELDRRFPGLAARLRVGDAIRPGLAVAIDGRMSTRGLIQKVAPGSEVHFLPAIGGG